MFYEVCSFIKDILEVRRTQACSSKVIELDEKLNAETRTVPSKRHGGIWRVLSWLNALHLGLGKCVVTAKEQSPFQMLISCLSKKVPTTLLPSISLVNWLPLMKEMILKNCPLNQALTSVQLQWKHLTTSSLVSGLSARALTSCSKNRLVQWTILARIFQRAPMPEMSKKAKLKV